jgi:hypothetical protein
MTCAGDTSMGAWEVVNPATAPWIPNSDGRNWSGQWHRETDTRCVLMDSFADKAVFILRYFNFPPDDGVVADALIGFDPLAPAGRWKPELTDELLALKLQELEQIQKELVDIMIDMGIMAAGVFDPTPISGLALMGRAIQRGSVLDAVLGGLQIVPYLGDLASTPMFSFLRGRRLIELEERLRKIGATVKAAGALKAEKARELAMAESATFRKLSGVMAQWKTGGTPLAQVAKEADELLPVLRNPRALAKHVNVDEGVLVRELEAKRFVRVKVGKHGKRGSSTEDSDIWVRKVSGPNGQAQWEAVRVDIKNINPQQAKQIINGKNPVDRTKKVDSLGQLPAHKTAAQLQGEYKAGRQTHMTMQHPTNPDKLPQMAADLNAGKMYKGDYTHWHHETFSAAPGNLERYLTKQQVTTRRLDFSGREVAY